MQCVNSPYVQNMLTTVFFVCMCTPFLHRAQFLIQTSHFSNMQGGRGDLQSSAQRSSLQSSQEARIDHPCVPAPNQFELLISVPVRCCTVLPFTQFRILLFWHFCDLNSDIEEHRLRNQLQSSKPVQCVFCLCYKVQNPPFLFRNLDILESVRFEIC